MDSSSLPTLNMQALTPAPTPKAPPSKPRSAPPVAIDEAQERITREVGALSASAPGRAALLLTTQARLAMDIRGDLAAANALLTRAASLAPDARFVAHARRWVAEQKGTPAEALTAARNELPMVGEARDRSALLWQIGALEEHAIGNFSGAETALREAVAIDPHDLGAWEALAALHLRQKQWAEAARAWEMLTARSDDRVLCAAVHAAIGSVREVYLKDTDGAEVALRRSLELDPTNVAAQSSLQAILLRKRAWGEYARFLAAEGDQLDEPGAAREAFERAGDVQAACALDFHLATACYERAAAMAPTDVGPLEKLEVTLERSGRAAEVPAILERQLLLVHDPVQRAVVLLRLGARHQKEVGEQELALAAYRRAVDAAPTFGAALQALLTLTRAQGRWAEVAVLELREADRIEGAPARATRYAAIAEILEARLANVDGAVDLYERALALDPGSAPASDALERIHRARGQWDALVALYEHRLAHAKDARRIRSLSLELAELHLRAGRPTEAAALLEPSLTMPDDGFSVLVTLARAHAEAGSWGKHVEVLEAQAKLLGEDAEIVAMLYRIGAAIETRLGDPLRATEAYERLLHRAPKHELALRAIARIWASEGHWDRLIATERRLLDLAQRPDDAAETLYRIGLIAGDRLGRIDEAVAAFEGALQRVPAFAPAAAELERLLRANGAHAKLAASLERTSHSVRDIAARGAMVIRAATISELHGDATQASALYAKALTLLPGSAVAQWGLYRLQESCSEWPAAEAALQAILAKTTESSARLHVLVRLARIHELRLGNVARAAALYEEALATGVDPTPHLVDRLRVARIEGKRETVGGWLGALAGSTHDRRLAQALLRLRALASEAAGAHAHAVESYDQALVYVPDDLQALDGLARNVVRGEGDRRLAATLSHSARVTRDTSVRALLLVDAGALFEERGLNVADAERAHAEALEAIPNFYPALDAARRLSVGTGNWPAVALLASRTAEAACDPRNIAEARTEAGDVFVDRLNRPEDALAQYRAVLAVDPAHPHAFARALRLLEANNDWNGAAEVLATRLEAVREPAVRAQHLVYRADLLSEKLGKIPDAITDLGRAVALCPEETGWVLALARKNEQAARWQDASQLYERFAAKVSDAGARRDALLAHARIWRQELRDYTRAQALLEEGVRLEPNDRIATITLAEVAALAGNQARAIELYRHLTSTGSSGDRAVALLALAEMQATQLGDRTAADACRAAAFDLAAVDPAVIALLEVEAVRTSDLAGFATRAEESLARAPAGAMGVLAIHRAVARVYRNALAHPESADRHLYAAVHSFPKSFETRLELASGMIGRNEQAALTELRTIVDMDPTVAGAYRGLLTVCQAKNALGAAAMMTSAVSLLESHAEELGPRLTAHKILPDSVPAEDALKMLIGPTRAWLLRSILAVLDPYLHEIFPAGQDAFAALSHLPDNYPVVADVNAVAAALGAGSVAVCRGTGRPTVLVMSQPRAIVLDADALNDAGRPRALFHAGYMCARIAAGTTLGTAVPAEMAVSLLEAAASLSSDLPHTKELRKRITSALPRRLRKELERIVAETAGDVRAEWAICEEEERKRGLSLAIVICRDLRAVAHVVAPEAMAAPNLDERRRLLGANPMMREALRFAASDAGWTLYARVHGRG